MQTQTRSEVRLANAAKGVTLAGLAVQLRNVAKEYRNSYKRTLDSTIQIGEICTIAKGMVNHGEFTGWARKAVPHFTIQWLRSCMRAYEANEIWKTRPDAHRVNEVTSVEQMAGMLTKLKAGVTDPFTAKVRSPNKVTVADLRAEIARLKHILDLHNIDY